MNKYLIDESVLLELIHYLSRRPLEEVAPLMAKLTQGLSSADREDIIQELQQDGTLANEEEKH